MNTDKLIIMLSELIASGKLLRQSQKAYFKERTKETLLKALEIEKQFDEALERIQREVKA